VGESRKFVPDDIRKELDITWREEITVRIGLKSYEDLKKELVI
jgi:hypothetical protein